MKRNELDINKFFGLSFFNGDGLISGLRENSEALRQVDIELKYEGYIKRQNEHVANFNQSEIVQIPDDFDYGKIKSLSNEGREKLSKVKPRSIGQASRISGVSPSDVSILTIYMKG